MKSSALRRSLLAAALFLVVEVRYGAAQSSSPLQSTVGWQLIGGTNLSAEPGRQTAWRMFPGYVLSISSLSQAGVPVLSACEVGKPPLPVHQKYGMSYRNEPCLKPNSIADTNFSYEQIVIDLEQPVEWESRWGVLKLQASRGPTSNSVHLDIYKWVGQR